MTRKRHVDYVRDFAPNLVPVIPRDATLSPNSTIPPGNRGKVPGERKDDGSWRGVAWNKMGEATIALAKLWDRWGAYIGARGGFAGMIGLDVDLTCREDVERVLGITYGLFGRTLNIRRVDHPEHVKLLICLRLEGPMPASFNIDVVQSDGKHGQIQFLGPGRYFNLHGVHPKRLKPYIWNRDPADFPLTTISLTEFEAFWAAIGTDFEVAHRPRLYAFNQVQRAPEQCTPEEMDALLELIPNDDSFEPYGEFIEMGAAMFGASAGAEWGRVRWLAWCDQVDQPQDRKPEIFWDSMHMPRSGAGKLRMFANERAPYEMAIMAFAEPEIEPEVIEQADEEIDARRTFLEGWALVGGESFYELPPRQPTPRAAFNMVHVREMKGGLRRALGGSKDSTAASLFALHSPNLVSATVHEPGQGRFVVLDGKRFLNLWSPPARPHLGEPIDSAIVDFYYELATFVLGSTEEAELWRLWHAWMLQNPGKAPGWGWIIKSGQGLGKDLLTSPIAASHGLDYTPVGFREFSDRYNPYAEKHLVIASEMRSGKGNGGETLYTALKELMSGNEMVLIRPMYQRPYLARNVAGFIVFSNKEQPLQLEHDDRRFHVVANFSADNRTPEYYAEARRLLTAHWAMIGEYLLTLPLSAAENAVMAGNAPTSEAKTRMVQQTAEQVLRELIADLESDQPPPEILPVVTTGELMAWLKHPDQTLSVYELPNRNELRELIYRLGVRPLNPEPKDPKQARGVDGRRLYRLVKTWRDKDGRYNLESMSAARLARLHNGRAMPPAELKAVDEGET
jgi:hypothetical protein